MATSKSVRAEGVLLLSALASKTVQGDTIGGSFFEYAEHLDVSDAGISIARAAYDAIPSMMLRFESIATFCIECLEAQYLLESGWEPGDDIECDGLTYGTLDAAGEQTPEQTVFEDN